MVPLLSATAATEDEAGRRSSAPSAPLHYFAKAS